MSKEYKNSVPKEAIEYLKSKGLNPAFHYQDVWLEEHNNAFTIAKMMNIDLLSDVRDSITTALKEGQTYKTWSKNITETLKDKGWWGKEVVTDPKSGEEMPSQLGCPRRLKIIFDVNTGQAYQKGVWERGYQSDSHTHILYRIGASENHRQEHLAWDGLVLPKDDPFWVTHNPINGYGCHCKSRYISKAKLKLLLKNGLPDLTTMDKKGNSTSTIKIKTEAPKLEKMSYINKRTGETHEGYEGIDPGFEHNPGRGNNLNDVLKEKVK